MRQRGGVLMLVGALLIVGGLGLAMAVLLVLLVMQLFVNIFTVPFTQELRWYGPGPLDADPGLRNAVLTATTVGSVLLVLGGIRRYVTESAPPVPPA
ncbi:MAG TPA: hypothetical protein VJS45_09155 [Acidimicrobiia bacterium]|nr:hypothetical protein [Acidimicrobiia bacterium]